MSERSQEREELRQIAESEILVAALLAIKFKDINANDDTVIELMDIVRDIKKNGGGLHGVDLILWSPKARDAVAEKLRALADLIDKVE